MVLQGLHVIQELQKKMWDFLTRPCQASLCRLGVEKSKISKLDRKSKGIISTSIYN